MLRHTVSFRLVHPEGSDAERGFLEHGRRVLTAVPGVQDFVVHRQVSPKSDHAFQFSMVFDDAAAYAAYDAHPDHRRFVEERWLTEVADFQELDLEPLDAPEAGHSAADAGHDAPGAGRDDDAGRGATAPGTADAVDLGPLE